MANYDRFLFFYLYTNICGFVGVFLCLAVIPYFNDIRSAGTVIFTLSFASKYCNGLAILNAFLNLETELNIYLYFNLLMEV